MKYVRSCIIVFIAAALAACATGPEKPNQRLLDYQAAAGAPVNSFRFFNLWSWEALDRSHLAVYTRGQEAYLLTVDGGGGCQNLEWANAIGLTSRMHEVNARLDKVLVGGPGPCFIMEIRPVDVGKLRAEEKLQKQRKIEEKERDAGA
ncbi:DUF6491 family protein [Dyella sp.]|uniref:DUF6491 family protein n=1 Tax=Dyella sp. TaxID=1869338 RepID=UPI002ED60C2D